jgi:NTE family protein
MNSDKFNEIFNEITKTSIFKDISQESLRNNIDFIKEVELNKGDYLFCKHDKSDNAYLIIKGNLFIPEINIYTSESELIGEIGVILEEPREFTAKASSFCRLIVIKGKSFLKILESNQKIFNRIISVLNSRLKENSVLNCFLNYNVKSNSRMHNELKRDMKEFVLKKIKRGETVFLEGSTGDRLHLLVHGKLHIWKEENNKKNTLAYVNSGELIGESALFGDMVHMASVTAVRDSTLVEISSNYFKKLLEHFPEFTVQLLKKSISRLQKESQEFSHKTLIPKTIAIIPLSKTLPDQEIIGSIIDQLKSLNKKVVVVSDELVTNKSFYNDFKESELTNCLFDIIDSKLINLEKEFDFVILPGHQKDTLWTKYCINNSDEVLFVADADDSPSLSVTEKNLIDYRSSHCPATRLLLFHFEKKTLPSGTKHWLKPRKLLLHHHIRWDQRNNDLGRVSRFIANEAIGVVLSGGGVKGFAHGGAVTALRELGIPIDAVGGTSIGSIAAGLVAIGKNSDELYKLTKEAALEGMRSDFTCPITSLLAGKYVMNYLKKIFLSTQIEDLWIPFFSVSTNLTIGDIYISQDGSLVDAVLSSMSIPGVYPPFILDNGEVLVDGGIIDNFPMDIIQELFRIEKIIGVDVASKSSLLTVYKSKDYYAPAWKILWNYLFKQKTTVLPNIFAVLLNAVTAGSGFYKKMNKKDFPKRIIIYPKQDEIQFYETDKNKESFRSGYEAVKKNVNILIEKGILKNKQPYTDRN